MRSGSQLRSLPAFHRLCAPGRRCPDASASASASAQVRHGWSVERAVAVRFEVGEELGARRGREAAGHADVVQHAVVVVEPEQQRADADAVLVEAEAGDDAVGGAQVLHLQHGALALFVETVERLGDHAVETRALEALEPLAPRCRGRWWPG